MENLRSKCSKITLKWTKLFLNRYFALLIIILIHFQLILLIFKLNSYDLINCIMSGFDRLSDFDNLVLKREIRTTCWQIGIYRFDRTTKQIEDKRQILLDIKKYAYSIFLDLNEYQENSVIIGFTLFIFIIYCNLIIFNIILSIVNKNHANKATYLGASIEFILIGFTIILVFLTKVLLAEEYTNLKEILNWRTFFNASEWPSTIIRNSNYESFYTKRLVRKFLEDNYMISLNQIKFRIALDCSHKITWVLFLISSLILSFIVLSYFFFILLEIAFDLKRSTNSNVNLRTKKTRSRLSTNL